MLWEISEGWIECCSKQVAPTGALLTFYSGRREEGHLKYSVFTSVWSWPLPSKFFPTDHSSTILLLNALWSGWWQCHTITLLSRLSPYTDEIIGDHECGFQCSRSTTDQIFCICQILETKWEYNDAVHQLFVDYKKAYDSVRREVLYNILIEFWVPVKLVRLIKMCLNETYSKVPIGKHLSESFPIQNGRKQGNVLQLRFRICH
jgi:hypothetical protein